MRYADVIVDISLTKLDKTFQYAIPQELEEQITVGTLVNVPFGKGGRMVGGFVLELSEEPKLDPARIKPIFEVQKKSITIEGQMITLAAWLREHYGSTMAQSLKTVIPIKKVVRKRTKQTPAEAVCGVEPASGAENVSAPADGRAPGGEVCKKPPDLTPEQRTAVEKILKAYEEGRREPWLLHGVTGSGKTEIYMRLMERMLSEGKETIVLIPEIALTFQTVSRFTERFGNEVLIMNSRLSAGEKYDQFEQAKNGECGIMVGPRSALFTPFQNLGLIIIDEEHENSFKSEQMPKYHARDVAIKRAELNNALVVLGSATPSVESYYRAKNGEYRYIRLDHRVQNRPLPECEIVDLRAELRSGNRSIFGRSLQEKIEDRLKKKEQVILFLNRRGMLSSLSCRSCGKVIKCPHCDVSLSLHSDRRLYCHYCGHVENAPETCPHCGSKYIGGFKAGTEKIEMAVKEMYPKARILRMDADTTKGKNGHEGILKKFAAGKADILIGTQMIVKGHDFPDVTLVGILAADLSLYVPDFRSAERTFQLLTQAAGRAGRADKPGEVIIQTYSPDHYAVLSAAAQDYERFYEEEIAVRSFASYPPLGRMTAVHMSAEDEELLERASLFLGKFARLAAGSRRVGVLGPTDELVAKIADQYRKVIYLKADDASALEEVRSRMEEYISINDGFNHVTIQYENL